MEARNNGTRYIEYNKWENTKYQPYNYTANGLLNKIMSISIVETKNPALKILLRYMEDSFIFVMKYIDILKNFKNTHWRNR